MTRFNFEAKTTQLKELEARQAEPGFWESQERAQKVLSQFKSLKALVDPLREVISRF